MTHNVKFIKKIIGEKTRSIKQIIFSEIKEELISKYMETFNISNENKNIVTQSEYLTNGEQFILVKDIEKCTLTLNNSNTNYIIIKSLTKCVIKPSENKIDEFYDELELENGSCVVLLLFNNNWYIVSSDGLKLL